MRFNGILTKWKDEKGFGFITPSGGGSEIFVHVSEFPKVKRPQVGDKLVFQVKEGAGGRRKAVAIEYVSFGKEKQKDQPLKSSGRAGGRWVGVVMLLILVVLGGYAYRQASLPAPAGGMSLDAPNTTEGGMPITARTASGFRCDGRQYCSQMTSCAEATFFNKNCPGVKMDGNHDGIPCETQWCK
jgi:cold shock CspA family protein